MQDNASGRRIGVPEIHKIFTGYQSVTFYVAMLQFEHYVTCNIVTLRIALCST
jgi:hypothetical protein